MSTAHPSPLEGFFSDDPAAAARALQALSGEGPRAASHGAVTSTGTLATVPGRDRLFTHRDGLLSEVIFGPAEDDRCACGATAGAGSRGVTCPRCGVLCDRASLRDERWGHVDVPPTVHPSVYNHLLGALGHLAGELRQVAAGERALRRRAGKAEIAWDVVPPDDLAEDDLIGPEGLAAALRQADPAHPLLALCAITRVPVPPPGDRPLAPRTAPTQVDPWIGPLNEAWVSLVERAGRARRLAELEAPPEILRQEAFALQQAFEAVFRATRRRRARLVPPLARVPDELDEQEALAMAFLGPDRLIVQRRERVIVLDLLGAVTASLPPAGTSLRGVAGGRYAVFEGFFGATHPSLAGVGSGFGAELVWEDEDGCTRMAHIAGEISVIDGQTGTYLERLPDDLPLRFVTGDEPEDLFLTAEDGTVLRRLRAGGDRPSALAYAPGLAHAWVGEEGLSTEIVELERGIPHAYPCEPEPTDPAPRWDFLADDRPSSEGESPGEREEAEEEGGEEEEEWEDEEGQSATAAVFRDGAWHLLWSESILCDHRGREPVRLRPAPRAAAFDPSGRTLALLTGDTVVLVDAARREVIRRWALP